MRRHFILYASLLVTITAVVCIRLVLQSTGVHQSVLPRNLQTGSSTLGVVTLSHGQSFNDPSRNLYDSYSSLLSNRSNVSTRATLMVDHSQSISTPTKLYPTERFSQAAHFPRVMIVGFGKAGTKALFEYLKRHPQLVGPPREMRFFSRNYENGLQSYLNKLPPPPTNGFVVEKSPDYILVPEVPERIISSAQSVGLNTSKLRFVVMLRNPINRAMSEYLEWIVQQKISHTPSLPPFEVLLTESTGEIDFQVKFINTSCYAYHIRHFLEYFDAKQVCFADGDQFIHQPYTVLRKLELCLHLRSYFKVSNFVPDKKRGFYCYKDNASSKPLCMGKNKGRTHPSIQTQVYEKLANYFKKWDEKLANVTGLQWSWFNDY